MHGLCPLSKLSVTSPTSQLILQPFRCFTYITAHYPTLISLLLHHRLFTYITWRAAHAVWPSPMLICSWAILNGISLTPISINPTEMVEIYWRHFYSGPMGPTPSMLSLNCSTVPIPSTLPGTLPPTMSLSAPLSMSHLATPNNISTSTAVTPYQPNAPYLCSRHSRTSHL